MIALVTVLAALITAIAALALLVLLAIGARREDPTSRLPIQAPGLLAHLARRIIGVQIRRPALPVPPIDAPRTGPCQRTEANQ